MTYENTVKLWFSFWWIYCLAFSKIINNTVPMYCQATATYRISNCIYLRAMTLVVIVLYSVLFRILHVYFILRNNQWVVNLMHRLYTLARFVWFIIVPIGGITGTICRNILIVFSYTRLDVIPIPERVNNNIL